MLDEHNHKNIQKWQSLLVRWFQTHGADYPWRRTTDPYHIMVSELMLQQTQVKTVLENRYYEKWIHRFPDVFTLAKAPVDEVLKAWEGLGYYNRARNLQKAAQTVAAEFDGVFPEELEAIRSLPGVGPYTAGAIHSFAYNRPAPIVDGNVIRVLARVFHYTDPVDTTAGKKRLWDWAEKLTSHSDPRDYNSAIMELGQKICLKGRPGCPNCPVRNLCASRDDPDANLLPKKQKSVKITRKQEAVLLFIKKNKILLCQESGSRRNGLWRLPALEIPLPDEDRLEPVLSLTYPITRYQVDMKVYTPLEKHDLRGSLVDKLGGKWFELSDGLPAMGAPYLRALNQFREKTGQFL